LQNDDTDSIVPTKKAKHAKDDEDSDGKISSEEV
jgi:hypothetical protein